MHQQDWDLRLTVEHCGENLDWIREHFADSVVSGEELPAEIEAEIEAESG